MARTASNGSWVEKLLAGLSFRTHSTALRASFDAESMLSILPDSAVGVLDGTAGVYPVLRYGAGMTQ